jgi:predicted RNase H-like HicB family nuclease
MKSHAHKNRKRNAGTDFKIIVEKHRDGYVAYPIGLKGAVVGEGASYDEALSDVKSAIRFHIETFGKEAFDRDSQVIEAFVAEARIDGKIPQ